MESFQLTEYRCKCGKLLFKGLVVLGVVEVKCRRCGALLRKEHLESGTHICIKCNDSLKIQSASKHLRDMCGSNVIGKQLGAIFPVLHDKSEHVKVLKEKRSAYVIPDNTLLLKNGAKVSVKSRFLRDTATPEPGYSILTWVPEETV